MKKISILLLMLFTSGAIASEKEAGKAICEAMEAKGHTGFCQYDTDYIPAYFIGLWGQRHGFESSIMADCFMKYRRAHHIWHKCLGK